MKVLCVGSVSETAYSTDRPFLSYCLLCFSNIVEYGIAFLQQFNIRLHETTDIYMNKYGYKKPFSE